MISDFKPRLSISAIDCLSRCGEQYRRIYVERERQPPGIALVIGRGVDSSVDVNLQHKIETGELLTLEEVQATRAHLVVAEVILARPSELDGGVDLMGNRGGLDHEVGREPATKTATAADEVNLELLRRDVEGVGDRRTAPCGVL